MFIPVDQGSSASGKMLHDRDIAFQYASPNSQGEPLGFGSILPC